jgi:hypothetical protein
MVRSRIAALVATAIAASVGTVVDLETVASSGSSGAIVQKSFAMPLTSAISGYYFISCSIPPVNGAARSGVINYVIDEA